MSDCAIRIEGLSKRYRLGERASYHRFTEVLTHLGAAPFRLLRRARSRSLGRVPEDNAWIWALRDVSFEVRHGEAVGFIGRNGAGKSTLLKILSRITDPSRGTAKIYGRVGSLLEVGTGFHPELTGRENIFLGGAVLGMSRAEVKSKLDEIVDFSEVERFLDTPVKHYSSGMHMRLAFAVAAHLEPEILVVDEVLAVGDAQFQEKCLGRMGTMTRDGRTVLFVSHNLTAVRDMCGRVILLDKGLVLEDGEPSEVISRYLSTARNVQLEHTWDDIGSAPGNDTVRLHRAAVRIAAGAQDQLVSTRTPLDLIFEFWNRKAGAYLNLSLVIYGKEGSVAFNTAPAPTHERSGEPFAGGLFRCMCRIPGDLLNDGRHSVKLLVVEDQTKPIYVHDDVLVFDVIDDGSGRGAWHGNWIGAVRPVLDWRTEMLSDTQEIPAEAPVFHPTKMSNMDCFRSLHAPSEKSGH